MDKEGSVDDDSVMYATLDQDRNTGLVYPYPFTLQELREYQDKLWKDAGGWDNCDKYAVDGSYFETYHIPFEDDGKQYVLNVMYGQGAAWTIFTKAAHDEYKARVAELDLKDEDEDTDLPN